MRNPLPSRENRAVAAELNARPAASEPGRRSPVQGVASITSE